jgi:hypothetical protein
VLEIEAMDGTRNALTSAAERRSVTKLRVVIADDHITFVEGFQIEVAFQGAASRDATGAHGMMTRPTANRARRAAARDQVPPPQLQEIRYGHDRHDE